MENRFLEILNRLAEKQPMDISFSVEHDFYDGRLEPLLDAIKLYTKECVKASFSKVSEDVVGEHCFINVSDFSDENNIILL